jgi:predicted  nucleic acid-binding Zn-ribbon protein
LLRRCTLEKQGDVFKSLSLSEDDIYKIKFDYNKQRRLQQSLKQESGEKLSTEYQSVTEDNKNLTQTVSRLEAEITELKSEIKELKSAVIVIIPNRSPNSRRKTRNRIRRLLIYNKKMRK